jgi:hypothetical protein
MEKKNMPCISNTNQYLSSSATFKLSNDVWNQGNIQDSIRAQIRIVHSDTGMPSSALEERLRRRQQQQLQRAPKGRLVSWKDDGNANDVAEKARPDRTLALKVAGPATESNIKTRRSVRQLFSAPFQSNRNLTSDNQAKTTLVHKEKGEAGSFVDDHVTEEEALAAVKTATLETKKYPSALRDSKRSSSLAPIVEGASRDRPKSTTRTRSQSLSSTSSSSRNVDKSSADPDSDGSDGQIDLDADEKKSDDVEEGRLFNEREHLGTRDSKPSLPRSSKSTVQTPGQNTVFILPATIMEQLSAIYSDDENPDTTSPSASTVISHVEGRVVVDVAPTMQFLQLKYGKVQQVTRQSEQGSLRQCTFCLRLNDPHSQIMSFQPVRQICKVVSETEGSRLLRVTIPSRLSKGPQSLDEDNEDSDDSGSDDDGQPKLKVAKPEVRNIMIAKYILNQTIQPVPMVRCVFLLVTADILVSVLT